MPVRKYEPTVVPHPVVHQAKNAFARDWPEEHKARLKALCGGSMSYAEITKSINTEFKTEYTRNAVLGKAARMGLSNGEHNGTKPKPKRTYASRAVKQGRPRKALNVGGVPVVFDGAQQSSLIRHEGDRGETQPMSKRLSAGDPQLAVRKLGRVPCIIESAPLTSTTNADRRDCQWPTSDDILNMAVCGAPSTCGAYCDRHASVAYRVQPTGKRNRRYHKRDQYQCVDVIDPLYEGAL